MSEENRRQELLDLPPFLFRLCTSHNAVGFKTKDLPTQTKNVEKSMTIADVVTNGIGNGHIVPNVSDIALE